MIEEEQQGGEQQGGGVYLVGGGRRWASELRLGLMTHGLIGLHATPPFRRHVPSQTVSDA